MNDQLIVKTPYQRPRHQKLQVRVTETEKDAIEKLAHSTGLSVAAFLRNVGLGYRVESILDIRKIDDLARMHADLGRLGGLLKLWLTDDPKTKTVGAAAIRTALHKIEASQLEMQKIMRTIITPKAGQ